MASQTLLDTIEQVRDFHEAFGISCAKKPQGSVGMEGAQLRHELLRGENEEYLATAKQGNLVEVADALGDMLYILCGTILKHGLQVRIWAVFQEIQCRNMGKFSNDTRPVLRVDGKVLKGENYFRPDIASVLGEKRRKQWTFQH